MGADYNTVKTLQLEINLLLDKENLMWQQRSRALFLKSGIATLVTFIIEPLITSIRGIVFSGLLKMMEVLNLRTQRRVLIQRRLDEEGDLGVTIGFLNSAKTNNTFTIILQQN